MTALDPLLDSFRGLDVLVVGDALLDDYLYGAETRICREAPVPAVTVGHRQAAPGGAANVAANAAALGARVRLVSVVGDDPDGRRLTEALRSAGVDVDPVLVDPERATVAKRRVVAGEQILMRFDEGGPLPLAGSVRAAVLGRVRTAFARADVVLVSDYGYGLLDDEVVRALGALQASTPRLLVVDARSPARYRDVGATAVKPNFEEIRGLLSDPPERTADRAAAVAGECARLHDATGAAVVAVTLDRDGAVVCERDRPPYRTWTRPVPHSRACGAGDSYTTAFALSLAAGSDVPVAAELAQAAATVVTGRDGTSTCSLDDLREHLAGGIRLEPLEALTRRAAAHRRQGRRIVFTNGCFDPLHRGHIDLLTRAKALGDVLVVGLNSDEGMARVKGRPAHRLEDRAAALAALSAVDHLVAFDDATADDLVAALRPDVYVKGGDYTPGMIPEAPAVEAAGGELRILPYLEDRAATALARDGVDVPR